MSETTLPVSIWNLAAFKQRPLAYTGRALVVFLRLFNGLFYFAAGINKFRIDWLWSDALKRVFETRVTELPGRFFAAGFLQNFAIPLYMPVAYVVTSVELISGVTLLLGLCTRFGAAIAIGTNFLFGIGGYYDASLIALSAMLLPVILTPAGHWAGLDARYAAKHPGSWWFK